MGEVMIARYTKGLAFLDDYFERSNYGAGGADSFAFKAPAAFFCLNCGYYIVNHPQGVAGAHADTQAAPVTLCLVYYRHFNQGHVPSFKIILRLKSTICL